MTLSSISVAALVATIAVSCTSRINVGLLAIALAWIVGVYIGPKYGQELLAKDVIAGFPSPLFVTLVGVTLFFTLAQINGTLEQVARAAERCCRGQVGLVPPMFFVLASLLSTIGAGNIGAAALVAPMAAAVATRTGIPMFLMVLMVGHGAIAGGLSPFTPMGIIAQRELVKMGLTEHIWPTYQYNLAANALVAFTGYLFFGGGRLLFRPASAAATSTSEPEAVPFRATHAVTLIIMTALILGVVFGRADVGLAAYAAATVMILLQLADERRAFAAMPWSVIVMVCGMTMLVAVVEKTGGLDLFTKLLASGATRQTLVPLIAWATGVISVFSSTSGVVLPTFLPTVPGLVEQVGGDLFSVATAINIGSGVVDVSPVSTIGALCIAPVTADEQRTKLFRAVLMWGLSMSLAGALVSWLLLRS